MPDDEELMRGGKTGGILRLSLTPRQWLIFGFLALFDMLIHIDYAAASLALVPIGVDVCADLNLLQWVLSAYVLSWGAAVIPAGRMMEMVGPRRPLLWGICFFLIGSLLAGLAHDPYVLIGGRICQGIGGAFIAPSFNGALLRMVPDYQRPFLLGLIGGIAGFGMALGPVLGGIIIDLLSWRWIFLINLPIGVVLFYFLYLFLPKEPVVPGNRPVWNVGRLVWLVLGIVMAAFALNQFELWGIQDGRLLGLLFLGLALVGVFVVVDHRSPHPIFPYRLLADPVFLVAIIILVLNGYLFSEVLTLPVLFLQNILEKPSDVVGLLFFPMCFAMGLLSPIGGRLTARVNSFGVIAIGMGTAATAVFLISLWDGQASTAIILIGLTLVGAGLGLSYPVLQSCILARSKRKIAPMVISFYSFATLIGDTLGVVLPTSFLVFFSRDHLAQLSKTGDIGPAYDQLHGLLGAVSQQSCDFSAQVQGHDHLVQVLRDCYTAGFSKTLQLSTLAGIIAVILSVWLARRRADEKVG